MSAMTLLCFLICHPTENERKTVCLIKIFKSLLNSQDNHLFTMKMKENVLPIYSVYSKACWLNSTMLYIVCIGQIFDLNPEIEFPLFSISRWLSVQFRLQTSNANPCRKVGKMNVQKTWKFANIFVHSFLRAFNMSSKGNKHKTGYFCWLLITNAM